MSLQTTVLILLSSLTIACADQMVGWPRPDETAPKVNTTAPAEGETGVAFDAPVRVTFDEPMAAGTFTGDTFTVAHGPTPITGEVTAASDTAVFTPTAPFEPGAVYTATVGPRVTDEAGNEMQEAFVWRFTARTALDTTPPQVSATSPQRDATQVVLNTTVTVAFNEPMDARTLTPTSFTLKQGSTSGGAAVAGEVTVTGTTAVLRPTTRLDADTTYTARVARTAGDLAGNLLPDEYVWTFTTGKGVDTDAPTVTFTLPANEASSVAAGAKVVGVFSETMDRRTLTTETFTVSAGAVTVAGTVSLSGATATFEATDRLAAATIYTARFGTGAMDLAGNALAEDYVWTFTTATAEVAAPTVLSTTPADGALAVAPGANLNVAFSEAMDPETVTGATFTLHNGGVALEGTVTAVDATATFAPAAALDPDTTYTATVSSTVTDVAGNPMAEDYVWTFTTGPAPDSTAPRVISTIPADEAFAVALGSTLTANFSELMEPLTLNLATFTVAEGAIAVQGIVSVSNASATFAPNVQLNPDTTYTARISSAASDLSGNTMAADFVWTFTTGPADAAGPRVISTTPASGGTEVALNEAIAAVFSEPMDPATLNVANFTLEDAGVLVEGVVSRLNATATFDPIADLSPGTTYLARIRHQVSNVAGVELPEDYVWFFTTGAAPDETAPAVISTTPASAAVAVAVNTDVSATFSEAMDPLTLTLGTFTLNRGAVAVPGAVTGLGATATFHPTDALDPDTEYSARITSGATDLAGNALAADFIWTFTTGLAPDVTAPRVTSTSPVIGAVDVAHNASITALFTEAMNPLTLTIATFTLHDRAAEIQGVVTLVGATATFNPAQDLAADTTFVARIHDVAADLAGNRLAEDFVWTFTTGASPDETAPVVSATIPADGDAAVVLNTMVTATFSEPMDALTVTPATFILRRGALVVPGAVALLGPVATFDPTDPLDPDTTYTATLSALAADLAGNPLAAAYTWTFRTGPQPDGQAPHVTFTLPSDDASGVATGGNIAAVFSEAMDPATITVANFSVQQLGVSVVGVVSYINITATFNPIAPLTPNTTYSATLTTGTRDLAGNALVRNFVWNFTTAAAADATRPTVISTIPADLEIGVARDAHVSGTFNEFMDPLTLTAATFTLQHGVVPVEVLGRVSEVGATALFEPAEPLDPNTEYTATLHAGAADLAGNTLAENYVWHFTTGPNLDPGAPTVILTDPEDQAIDVAVDTVVNATFSDNMDPLSITTVSYTVTGPGLLEVPGTVQYDVQSRIATFTPDDDLLPATEYTATLTVDVADLAGNPLAQDYVWRFSTGEMALPGGLVGIDLGSLSTFVAVAGAGLTNSNSSGITVLNGDVGLSPTATCLGDGAPCSAIDPVINGTLYANDPAGVAAQAKVDLTAAYVDGMSRPVGTTVNDISGMVLVPGVYSSDSTMSIAVGGQVVLDGQGNANSVWIFQVGSSLTVNNSAQVLLINGARAKNVFWAIFASSTLGSNVQFAGSVLAGASNSVGTDTVVSGRLLCRTGQITLLSDTITLPPL